MSKDEIHQAASERNANSDKYSRKKSDNSSKDKKIDPEDKGR